MRLSFYLSGDEVTCSAEVGTLALKRACPFRRERVAALSHEAVSILARGNRGRTIVQSAVRQLQQVGSDLAGELLPAEIRQSLDRDREVYLHVDESLVHVPWELIFDGREFWCERFDLGRAVSTPQTIARRSAEFPSVGPIRMLVICASQGGRLAHVVPEGEALIKCLDQSPNVAVDLLVDPTLEVVRRRLTENDIVHFAGHGDHEPQKPENGGWQLKDGIFRVGEILSLAGRGTMPVLVFSNACRSGETAPWLAAPGLPAGSVYGLANAFLLAGVRLYIGTQWEVVDRDGADFALAFYQALARGGSAGTSMRVARREIRTNNDGLSWASYVLYGSPSLAPVMAPEGRTTGPLLPTKSRLEARVETPWKRHRPVGSLADTTELKPPPEKRDPSLTLGRPPAARARLVLAAALCFSLGFGLALALGRLGLIAFGAEDASAPGAGHALSTSGARLSRATAMPLVALAVGAADDAGQRCLRWALEQSGRFRLADEAKVIAVCREHEQVLGQALSVEQANVLAQTVHAEFVVYPTDDSKQLAVLDVLTGEVISRQRLDLAAQCRPFVEVLRRLVHGEGRVTAVSGQSVTIDIGWRSRVYPGQRLLVVREKKQLGEIELWQVQLDQSLGRPVSSIAIGVGDEVLVSRGRESSP
jgi:hypothetical protein